MARLFISHSSQDNFEAKAFHDWLVMEGWATDDIFLDLHDLGAGVRWKQALAKANERCEAVVLLASPASLSSTECRLEIRMAEDYGKEIIVAILHLLTPQDKELEPYRERQIVELALDPRNSVFTVEHAGRQKAIAFNQRTLRTIKARLDQLGISPNTFTWRPQDIATASPYPGFESFKQGEAALFFGRASDIARGLADLRKLRRLGTGQILLIQAASGAGKSSYLKAGLWPRLERDPEFLPMAILRPAMGILTGENGLGHQFARFFAKHREPRTPAGIHQVLRGDADVSADALVALINEATAIGHTIHSVARPDAPLPTPVIAVDQAEELFAAADHAESDRFRDILARVLDPERSKKRPGAVLDTPPLFVWTLRADSLDALMHAANSAGIKPPQPFLLPPIPRENYREIIEQPVTIANQAGMKISIDPLLTNELIDASRGADALPLLAFTLRQLMAEGRAGAQARLTLEDYVSSGGLEGVLKKRLTAAQLAANASNDDLRRLIIPGLATWDDEATPPSAKRLVADEAQLLAGRGANLKPLINTLVEGRLITRSGGEDGRAALEVAHEALLRLAPISTWLHEDRNFLIWLANISRARQLEKINTGELFFGGPLEDAKRWLAERHKDIPADDRAFIENALSAEERRRKEEQARHEKELAAAQEREALALEAANASGREAMQALRVKRRTLMGLGVALTLSLALVTAILPFGTDIDVQNILTKLPEPRSWSFDGHATRVAAIVEGSGRSLAKVWQLAPSPLAEPIITVPATDARMSPDGQHLLVLDDQQIFLLSTNGPARAQNAIVDFRLPSASSNGDGASRSLDGGAQPPFLSLELVHFTFDGKWLLVPTQTGVFSLVNPFSTDQSIVVAQVDPAELSGVRVAVSIDRQEFLICSSKSVTLVSPDRRPMASSQAVKAGEMTGCGYGADEKLVIVKWGRVNATVLRISGGALEPPRTVTFPTHPGSDESNYTVVITSKDGSYLWGRSEHGPIAIADLRNGDSSEASVFLSAAQSPRYSPYPIFWRSFDGRWIAGTGEEGDLFAWRADGSGSGLAGKVAVRERKASRSVAGSKDDASAETLLPVVKFRPRSETIVFSPLNHTDRALVSNGRGVLLSVDLGNLVAAASPSEAIGRLSGRNYGLAPFKDDTGWQAVSTAEVQLVNSSFEVIAKSPTLLDEIGVTVRAGDGSGLWAGTETGLVRFRKVIKLWGRSIRVTEWPQIAVGLASSAGATTSDGGRMIRGGGGDGGGDGGGGDGGGN